IADLALLLAQIIVLGLGLDRGLVVIVQDVRLHEDHQVGLVLAGVADLEQLADDRNPADPRHALLGVGGLVLDQAADHQRATVGYQHGGLDGALVGDQVDRSLGARGDARHFDLDLEHHRVALADLRGDAHDRADLFALYGLERGGGAHGAGAVLAGQERHFLRHFDLGLLVVAHRHGGPGDDVATRVALQRAPDRREIQAGLLDAPDRHGGAGDRAVGWHGAGLGGVVQVDQRGAADRLDKSTDGEFAVGAIDDPVDAQVRGVVGRDLDDDGLHHDLRAADVELVNHRIEGAHGALGRGDHQRVGVLVGPDLAGAPG